MVNEFKLHAQFLISNRASVASEKILEKIRGKSYSPVEMECNNHSYVRLLVCSAQPKINTAKISRPLLGRGPISRMGLVLQHQ